MLLGGIVQKAWAQDKTFEFNLNVGAMTHISFDEDVFFTLGGGLDFHLGKHFMISPEFQLWTGSDLVLLNLGAILNFKLNNFFFGGGEPIG
jgi:hypothetical protein